MHRMSGNVVRHVIGQKFVEHHAEGVDVTSDIDVVGVCEALLRRHVLKRSNQFPDICLERMDGNVAISGSGNTEIDDLRVPLTCHQYVSRLQIAMNDAFLMSMMCSVADLSEKFEFLLQSQLLVSAVLSDGLCPDEKFHGEPWCLLFMGIGTGFVYLGNARVPESGKHLGLILESLQCLGRGQARFHHLQCHSASRCFLRRLVDGTHPAGADDPVDGELAKSSPDS